MLNRKLVTKKSSIKSRRKIKLFKQEKHPIMGLFSKAMKHVINSGIEHLKDHHFSLLKLKTSRAGVEKHRQMMRHK